MNTRDLQEKLLAVLPVWNYWIARPFKQLLNDGVSINMYYCVEVLRWRGHGMAMSELARYMRLPKQRMTKLADQLTERGFVERVPSREDRRSILLQLTEKGLGYVDRFLEEDASCFRELLERMSPEDRQALGGALETLMQVLSKLPVQVVAQRGVGE